MTQAEQIHELLLQAYRHAKDAESVAYDARSIHLRLAAATGQEPMGRIADAGTLAHRLRALTLEGDDVPLFSEDKLYDLIGKENARTVLAMIEDAIKELERK